MARIFSSRLRMGLAALLAVLVIAGVLLYARAQAGTAVEVVSGERLLVGAQVVEAAVAEAAEAEAAGQGISGAVLVETAAEGDAGPPRAALSADFHNFGAVGSAALARKDFLLINRGGAPLRVARAYTTCGCTTAEISAAVIPPGKAARITLAFDAAFHPAAGQTVRRGLILETNDPARPVLEIWVQASVGK